MNIDNLPRCECGASLPGTPGRPNISAVTCTFCGKRWRLGWERVGTDGEKMTLPIVRAKVRDSLLEGGSTCPCCERRATAYKRRIHKDMALFLIELLKLTADRMACDRRDTCGHVHGEDGEEWIHIREMGRDLGKGPKASSDGAYLKIWGMVLSKPALRGEPSSGYYSITKLGAAFALGNEEQPLWAMVYNNKALSFSEKTGTIKDCLAGFNYEEAIGFVRWCSKCDVVGHRTCPRCGDDLRAQDAHRAQNAEASR